MREPNAIVSDGQSQKTIFYLLDEHGFKWNTPLEIEPDEDMFPEGIAQCVCCKSADGFTFNMTNFIDGVSWSLHNCHLCGRVSYFRDEMPQKTERFDYTCGECGTNEGVRIIDSWTDIIPCPDTGGSCSQVTEQITCENCGTSHTHIYIA